jgi:hypothetical protein
VSNRAEIVEEMLDSSQRVRDQLMAAVGRLDSYIELLRTDLDHRDTTSTEATSDPAAP